MKRALALGLATAGSLLAAGCGESAPQSPETTPHPVPQIAPHLQKDLQAVMRLAPEAPNLILDHFDPSKYYQVGKVASKRAGVDLSLEIYSAYPNKDVSNNLKLTQQVQGDMAAVAKSVKNINLNVYDVKTKAATGHLKATLNVINAPTALILAKNGDVYRTDGRNNAADGTYRATDKRTPDLKESISFVSPSDSAFNDTFYMALQACNAKIDVETGSDSSNVSAQNIICSSFAFAYASAYLRQAYKPYISQAEASRPIALGSKSMLRWLILPKKAYTEIQSGKPPLGLDGIMDGNPAGVAPLKPGTPA